MSISLYPTAGYIWFPDAVEPGVLSSAQAQYLRSLASRVAEIAAHPKQTEKRNLWFRHNALEKVRPMVLAFPEGAWVELLPPDCLRIEDDYWKGWEWYLRHLIYRDERFHDDFVVEPNLYIPLVVRVSGFGLDPVYHVSETGSGGMSWEGAIKEPDDIHKLRIPDVQVDESLTGRQLEAVSEVLGDILPVRMHCMAPPANLIGEATALRGMEQFMLDMHERPEWLHDLMEIVTDSRCQWLRVLEVGGYLTLNNGHHYNDSGGIGYSKELPKPGFDPTRVRPCDIWGFGVAQEAVGMSPAQHEEFILHYQLRLLEKFGLNAYGCCEPYTDKFDMVINNVPRLRRVSVSPWCDTKVAAEKLQDRYIYSWKPNPAMIVNAFDEDAIRQHIRTTLDTAKGCVVEIIHKDTATFFNQPWRIEKWTQIAHEEAERLA